MVHRAVGPVRVECTVCHTIQPKLTGMGKVRVECTVLHGTAGTEGLK